LWFSAQPKPPPLFFSFFSSYSPTQHPACFPLSGPTRHPLPLPLTARRVPTARLISLPASGRTGILPSLPASRARATPACLGTHAKGLGYKKAPPAPHEPIQPSRS